MDDDISGGLVEAGTVRRQSQSGFFFKNLASWTLKILCTHGTRGGRRGGERVWKVATSRNVFKNRHIHSCYLYIFLVQVPSVIIHKAVKNGLIVCVSQPAVIRSVYTYLLTNVFALICIAGGGVD